MKKGLRLLCIALVLILVGSIAASIFNTGNGATTVSRISFEADHGTLSGLLYMPKDASATNPKATIIVTHGYLNSAEMQDANAIELSRRGFVVLALDQYDHGHSDLNNEVYGGDTSFFGVWRPFWNYSMFDAVKYMYNQPYVLKDENGNGMIGVTGHSMGGFSSTMAVYMDEQNFATAGYRMIHASLTEGSDFSYTGMLGNTAAVFDANGGGRFNGKVAAHYDEFFFAAPGTSGVRYKDYVSTPDGMTFLQQTEPATAGKWYDTTDGGRRVIYEPSETHPWNHFSKTTTASAVDFYLTAFEGAKGINAVAADNQVWQLKEAFECVALVGFVMLLIAVASLLIELPFFKMAKSGKLPVQASPKGGMLAITVVILCIAIILPCIVFQPLMDGNATIKDIVFYAAIVAAVAGVAGIALNLKNKKGLIGGCLSIVSGALLALVVKTSMYGDNGYFTAIGVNSIAYWTIGCALISATILSTVYTWIKSKDGVGLAAYGISFKPTAIIGGICTGLVTVAISYAVLFLVDAVLKVDFRIWTFAFKTFDANLVPAILHYLPTFLLFYVISTIGITINTNTTRMNGAWGYVLAILLNAGGGVIWLCLQYGTLFNTGVAYWPGSALSGIMMFAMVPTLAIAAIISRNLTKKTGNIWTAAVLNAVLMTIMTIANTMVVYK
ncbi:MAG: lysophospholipase [Clostridia bacterium]|nr:lysophospholipase [Clostridia bacterium]